MASVPEPLTGRLHRLFERAAAARERAAAIGEGLPDAGEGSWWGAARLSSRVLDEVDTAVVATDPVGRVTHWNAAAERLYGWTAEEAVGAPAQRLLVPASADWDALEIMAAVLSEGSWEGRFSVRRKDGAVFPVHVRDVALTDEHGKVVAVVGVSREISGELRAADELRAAGDELRAVAGMVGAAIVVLHEGCVAFANDRAARLLRYPPGGLEGRAAADVVPMVEGLRGTVEKAPGVALTREGTPLAVTISARPIAGVAGTTDAVVLLVPAERAPASG